MDQLQQITKTKIENGVLMLPQTIQKLWQNKEVIILPEENRFIVQALEAEWDEYEKKINKGRKKLSSKIIDEAAQWAKKQS